MRVRHELAIQIVIVYFLEISNFIKLSQLVSFIFIIKLLNEIVIAHCNHSL